MRLDHTRIPIRERTPLGLLDLSLRVTAAFAGPLICHALVAVVPIMLVNWWLIGWVPQGVHGPPDTARYVWLMAQLVFIEVPLASLLTTQYLGNAIFYQKFGIRESIANLRKVLPQLVWCQFLMRGIIAAWLLAAAIGPEDELSMAEVFLPILTCYVVVARAFRPFVNEIVLLERNPWRGGTTTMTVRRRSRALHNPSSGDLWIRWMGSAVLAILMTISVTLAFWSAGGAVMFSWDWGPIMLHVGVPGAMWIVAGYFSVVRFLSYLDLRIRSEGWEVELLLRAAAARYAKQDVLASDVVRNQ